MVGSGGMGALSYRLEWNIEGEYERGTLGEIADACRSLLPENDEDNIDMLYRMARNGGARPKVLINMENEDWVVKFPSSYNSDKIGRQLPE